MGADTIVCCEILAHRYLTGKIRRKVTSETTCVFIGTFKKAAQPKTCLMTVTVNGGLYSFRVVAVPDPMRVWAALPIYLPNGGYDEAQD